MSDDLHDPPSSCPFCGELDCQLYHRQDTRTNDKGESYKAPAMWRVRCWSCFAEGPADPMPGKAARMWEARFPRRPNRGWSDDDDDGGVPRTPITPKTPEPVS